MMQRIAAGIVAFNPDIKRLEKNISAILPQVEALYIIDNNSDNIQAIENYIQKKNKIVIKKNEKNLGIAKALNQMCDLAISNGFDWVLTLDQDTICPSDMINKYLPFCIDSQNAIICPQFAIKSQSNRLVNYEKHPTESIRLCITSASLTRLATWEKMQGFNEWLFIDGVDYDYCLRARRLGGRILRVNDVVIDHQVGIPQEIHFPLGIAVKIYNHSPFRNYYIVRNNIYLLRHYWKDLNGFLWLLKFIYFEVTKLLFESNRGKIIYSLCKGVKDGLFI